MTITGWQKPAVFNAVSSAVFYQQQRGNFSSRTGFYCRSPEFPDPLGRVLSFFSILYRHPVSSGPSRSAD
ncbi:hypothetical protein FPOAC1_000862 [Fusarium poae]|uniref:hypothetical protein n=1 Tax=Fusarium poae TaxID=36050 RepID=UPI001CE75E21|nr:hypothetical protein FPOAC1_000862 [Fusarium poae]KAG8674888.1 hypothetical protein FPOAC1_000862 [Fusarium poae]